MSKALKILLLILLCEAAGIIGAFFTAPAIPTWYAGLIKPELNPPSWVFGPVWTLLYALMGIALYLVLENKSVDKRSMRTAVVVFGAQLIFNAIWSIIFFGYQNVGLAFADIIVLWILIIGTIWAFSRISKPASWLLVPYLLWVTFASYLNYSILILN